MGLKFRISVLFNALLGLFFCSLLIYAKLSLYLLKMAYGQAHILVHTQSINTLLIKNEWTSIEKEKILWIEKIKKYSVDSLAYKPTKNFTTYYNQHGRPILWIVTACKQFSFEAYEWSFPLLGKVSYKGFFSKEAAEKEKLRLYSAGYDADISEVSAWSTLGWLPDPVLSSMLYKSKGRMANLFFHELFHATYYAPSSVDVNENLANFVARKASLQFLKNDPVELTKYMHAIDDDSIHNTFVFSGFERLKKLYHQLEGRDTLYCKAAKQHALEQIYAESFRLKLHDPNRFKNYNRQILLSANSFFVDARRYDGLSDSLNRVLKEKYGGRLKKMIIDLKK